QLPRNLVGNGQRVWQVGRRCPTGSRRQQVVLLVELRGQVVQVRLGHPEQQGTADDIGSRRLGDRLPEPGSEALLEGQVLLGFVQAGEARWQAGLERVAAQQA